MTDCNKHRSFAEFSRHFCKMWLESSRHRDSLVDGWRLNLQRRGLGDIGAETMGTVAGDGWQDSSSHRAKA